MLARPRVLPDLRQRLAEVVVGVGVVGHQRQRSLERGDGAAAVADLTAGDPEVVPGLGVVRRARDRRGELVDRVLASSQLVVAVAEVEVGLRAAPRQRVLVGARRVLRATGRLGLDADREPVLRATQLQHVGRSLPRRRFEVEQLLASRLKQPTVRGAHGDPLGPDARQQPAKRLVGVLQHRQRLPQP